MGSSGARARRTLFVSAADQLVVQQRPIPDLGSMDALIRVEACGICGSDLGYLAAGGLPISSGQPLAIGHELAGIVEAVGTEVSGITPGDRVTVNPDINMIGAGSPEAGFSDWLVVHDVRAGANVLLVPHRLSAEVAALTEPLAVGLHGVNQARITATSKVVVFGVGMIGLGAVIGLHRRGVRDIVAVDLNDVRLELARRYGAGTTVNPAREDLVEVLAATHGAGQRYGWRVVGTDAFIDTAGSAVLVHNALAVAKAHARLVVVALHKKPVPLDLLMLMGKELEIVGSCAYPQEEFAEVLHALAAGEFDPSALITHRFPFDRVTDAFNCARAGGDAIKVMVTF
jgi:2-desacetyl-2-hydroxyethyl bacteriochlorophyllide A dehydrogenase